MNPQPDKSSAGTVTSVPPNNRGERVFQYVEVDANGASTGRSVSFLGVEFQALQYSDLINQKLNQKVIIPLRWQNARILESTIPELTIEGFASGNATLESIFSSSTIGLVKGGWLPSGLALQEDMLVLPDRCTITELAGRFHSGIKKNDSNKDFLDFFADHPIRLNPLLYALEGNIKSNPTPEVVKQQFEEACAKIKASLPLAELVPADNGGLQGVIGIIADTQAGMTCKQNFLIHLAPELRAPVSKNRLPHLWNKVLTTADDFNVPRRSLVVLAVLSAISVSNKSPAKALLKLTATNYSIELAYNALADLRALELLMHLFALYPNERILLCTGDKDLALFWAGIRASNFSWSEDQLNFKLSPTEELLPNVTPERRAFYFDMEDISNKGLAP